tara:strand:- start:1042 stop:2883 length:1842 start_codon:yes stop_codon:yes gene_type:complete
MGTLKVNSITNEGGDGPVTFENGIVASADNLLLKPGVSSFEPSNLSVDVDESTSIQIGFNQNMQFTGIGTIHIRSGSASGSIVTSFTCGVSTEATIENNLLTISPRDALASGTVFYVTLPSAGIANTVGSFIDPVTSYNFKTQFTPFNIQGGDFEQIIVSPTSPTGYYKYNIFTSSGIATFTSPSASATDFTYVMVGGGGGGGSSVGGTPYPYSDQDGGGGGGGAGGYVKNYNSTNLPAKNYNVTIGGGGSGCWSWPGGLNSDISPGSGDPMGNFPGPWNPAYLANYSVTPTSGNNSSFGPTPVGTIVAYGGGAGGYGAVRGNSATSPSEWNYNPRIIDWGQTGYLPTNIAPPTNPAWYPSPYQIIPQPSSGPYNQTITRPANLWECGGRPGGSGGGHSGKAGYAPYRYFYRGHGLSKLSVTAASGQAYPSPNSQGYPGGAYQVSTPVPGSYMVGSGGGGAGGSGGNGGRSTSGTYPPTPPGRGGNGKPTPEFPSPVLSLIPGFPQSLLDTLGSSGMLAGGGGGTKAIYYPSPYNDSIYGGGSGGGGNGYQRIPTQTQLSERGVTNTGGGGGAGGRIGGPTANPEYQTTYNGWWLGQNGGSGIMMFRYAHPGS